MALERLTQITNSGITSGITITGVNLTGVITATSANVGSGITLSGTQINVGSATTIHSSGFQIGSSSLHSTGISVNNINASGIVTATTFNGNLTGNVTGNATGLSGTPSITVATINASNATFSGNVSVAGTVTYEDVTNVDSVGIITARSGVRVNSGGLVVTSGVSTFTNLVVSAGSTSAPSISPTGDSNTGIFFPSPDTVSIAEGGVEILRVNSSGNLGIGTNNPSSTVDILGLQANTGSTSASVPTGTLRLAYDGASEAGNYGSSLVFTQRYFSGQNAQVAVGQIAGVKIAGGGNYGGGLALFTSNGNGNDLVERVRIDSSGNLGIGTNNPFAKTHIEINAAAGAGSGSAAALWLRNSNQTSNNSATIFAGNNSTQASAAINFIHQDYSTNAGAITFDTRTNSTTYAEKVRITSTGNVQIANGNLVFSTAGTGIDFSATANSSGSMTSELLSDYEVGTWTPIFYLDGVLQNYDADRQSCFYTKIGNLVYVQFWTGWGAYGRTAFPSSSSAVFEIGGLPYVSADAFYGGSMGNARTQSGTSDNLGLSILYQTDKISFTSNSGNFGSWYSFARRSASSISGSANVVIAGAITYVA